MSCCAKKSSIQPSSTTMRTAGTESTSTQSSTDARRNVHEVASDVLAEQGASHLGVPNSTDPAARPSYMRPYENQQSMEQVRPTNTRQTLAGQEEPLPGHSFNEEGSASVSGNGSARLSTRAANFRAEKETNSEESASPVLSSTDDTSTSLHSHGSRSAASLTTSSNSSARRSPSSESSTHSISNPSGGGAETVNGVARNALALPSLDSRGRQAIRTPVHSEAGSTSEDSSRDLRNEIAQHVQLDLSNVTLRSESSAYSIPQNPNALPSFKITQQFPYIFEGPPAYSARSELPPPYPEQNGN